VQDAEMKQYFIKLVLYLMEKNGWMARLLFNAAAPLGRSIRNYRLVNLEWVDETDSKDSGILRQGGAGIAYGPVPVGAWDKRSLAILLPDVMYRTFENGTVSAMSSSVLKYNGVLAIERVGKYTPDAFDFSAGYLHKHRGKSALIKIQNKAAIERGIFLGGNGAFNYYHWLIEIVPKLEFIEALPEHYRNFPLLVSAEVFRISSFNSILSRFAPSHRVIVLESNLSYEVRELVFIDAPNNLPFNLSPGEASRIQHALIHPGSIRYIRQKCLTNDVLGNRDTIYPKKIFLKRKLERRKYNQDEVERFLRDQGFVSIFMEDLSFDEQVRTMHHAEWVVGPTGAAWTNLVFCKQGTNALCWMAEEVEDFSAFSTIAGHVGVNLKYLTHATGMQSTAELYYADYEIDVKKIESAISEAGVARQLLPNNL
jgi:capsular polysaccharide biosynthesis protein